MKQLAHWITAAVLALGTSFAGAAEVLAGRIA